MNNFEKLSYYGVRNSLHRSVFIDRCWTVLGVCLTAGASKCWRSSSYGGLIAFATVVFQTITNNRILTPSIKGEYVRLDHIADCKKWNDETAS